MDMRWTVHLPREAASVPMARRLLVGAMETAGVDPQVAMEIGLALSEACANVVAHARCTTGSGTEYLVRAGIAGDRCRVEVIDAGPGFTAERLHAPVHTTVAQGAESGRGLLLIEAMTDRMIIRNRPHHGAVLRFEKALRWRKDTMIPAS